MKLKFMTPRQAKKDQHTLKEKIEKERIEKTNINCRRKGNWRKRKGSKEQDYGKGSREQGVYSKATLVQLHSFTKANTML